MTAAFRSMLVRTAIAAAVLGSAVVLGGAQRGAPGPDPLVRFRAQVAEYMTLKARVASTVPPRTAARSFDEFIVANDRLRRALQHARLDVGAGNIFVADARPMFRSVIVHTLDAHGIDVSDLLADMKLDREPNAPKVRINEPFPKERGFLMVPCLLESLPALPRDLRYRLDDRDLVLVDFDVNLVLDVLDDALPRRRP
jgi:hypothetical protein